MAYAERAIERIYGDEALTDEMMDTEAEVLLKWGEDAVFELDSDDKDEETFDSQFKQVRRLMKCVNKFIGLKINTADETEMQEALQKFEAAAAELGYAIETERLNAFFQVQKTLSNPDTVKEMLALLQQSAEDAAPMQPETDETAMIETTEKPLELAEDDDKPSAFQRLISTLKPDSDDNTES
jgi:dihydrodipicolinate synthase/N-acetylneuraminate lyase